MFYSFFNPTRFLRHFDQYFYFTQLPGEVLVPILEQMYAAEEPFIEGEDHQENLRDVLDLGISAATGLDPNKPVSSFEARRFWNLDFVLWGSKIGDPEFRAKFLSVEGLERTQDTIRQYGSCVFVLPHHGPHRAASFVLASLGLQIAITGGYEIEDTLGGVKIAQFHQLPIDEGSGVTIGPGFKERVGAQLMAGRSVAVYPEYSLADRLGSLSTEFLGQCVHVPTGAARLAAACGRPLIFCALVPQGEHRYRMVFDPPVAPAKLLEEGGVDAAMIDSFRRVEALVRAEPAAWEGWRTFPRMMQNGEAVRGRQAAHGG